MVREKARSLSIRRISFPSSKFLYSDHEIFLRELVNNAVDANAEDLARSLGHYNQDPGEPPGKGGNWTRRPGRSPFPTAGLE